MTDYINSFGGAAKDAANSTILGADQDTQYDAIETASATKANKVTSATLDNILAMDANGDLKDSGVTTATLDNITEKTAIATGHVRAGNMQIVNGSNDDGILTIVDVGTDWTEDAWESLGPTGSGATNIWTAMDYLPADATILIVDAYLRVTTQHPTGGSLILTARDGDSTYDGVANNQRIAELGNDGTGSTQEQSESMPRFYLPLNGSQVVDLHYTESVGVLNSDILLYYRGFMTD